MYPSDGSVKIELTFKVNNFQGDDAAVNTILKKDANNFIVFHFRVLIVADFRLAWDTEEPFVDREIEDRSMLGKFSAISLMLWFFVAPFLKQIEGSNVSSSKVSENSISNKIIQWYEPVQFIRLFIK